MTLITPYGAQANNGNWHTAARWARFLRPLAQVRVATSWDGTPADLMIALHARRSAASIAAFAAAHPRRPLVVVLTGTDVYRDIHSECAAQRSLQLASRLVVLQERGLHALPAPLRRKTCVIVQSARALRPGTPRRRTFDVAVVGHLRAEKDPRTAMQAARLLPAASPIRLLHVGAALDPALGRAARATAVACAHYRWLGGLARGPARQLVRRARLLLHPSLMEGGAQAIIEAIRCGTPVVASDCDGNLGLLGADYPGLFPVGEAAAAAALLQRAREEPAFLRQLAAACRRRAPLFAPSLEMRAVQDLLALLAPPAPPARLPPRSLPAVRARR